ncbi:MAG: hypothetical protein ACKOF9_06935, partial [Burkholderiales bacterium]
SNMKLNLDVRRLAKGAVAVVGLLSGLSYAAPPTWLPPVELPDGTMLLQVEELKATYLQCDRLASVSFLDSSTAADCSVVAEKLRRIGFDGRADAVLEWWRSLSEDRRAGVLRGHLDLKARSASL